ncbi:REST corepressor 2-like [Hirundo rustica]|uniref:REST corepressor 2-like n=1 Tax=Hirundo rustica TaxID=43150 RepID=UPI001A94179A|nr:REST corepressor 2-like [Hirundo rustica]
MEDGIGSARQPITRRSCKVIGQKCAIGWTNQEPEMGANEKRDDLDPPGGYKRTPWGRTGSSRAPEDPNPAETSSSPHLQPHSIPIALWDCQRHINVGSEFQAELPELQSRAPSEDEEPASLVWKPWGEDDSDMQKPDRVRELLDMASSRGVPRAEAKLELALHCLHQARGSVPEALEMLLSGGPPTAPGHPLADYHYADSDRWTPEEKESFEKALHSYGKDFHLIQKQIQSKTVAQCVEYYYCSWKKERKLASAAAQSVGKAERSKSPGRKENGERGKRSRKRPRKAECPCCPAPQPPRSAPGPFACRQCKRHINVGSEFQAELPELQSRAPSEDEEPASLVWKPWGEDDSDMQKPDRVRELLDMASSRGVPRAEAKLELALHCLHQARGSVPEALEMLLSGGPPTAPGHPLADYHYADSDRWTPEEKESFEKALHTYGKDFHLIQKQIQSKTVAQCVEYYYCSWKKERKLASAAAQSVGKAERSKSPGRKENGERGKRSRKRPRKAECPCCPAPQPPRSAPGPFACRQCKRVFESKEERDAHRRRYGPKKGAEPVAKKKRPN